MEYLSQIFWIFIIFTALTPYLQQQMLRAGRTRKLIELERKRGSRVITLIHRQEAVNLLGVPLTRFINIEDSEQVLTAIRLTDDQVPIDLIIHTPGGLVLASEQIAEALLRHPGKVTVFVPHYAMSGGTLVAMAADELVMDQNAVLGPLDPQLGQYPAASIVKVLDLKPISEVDDQTVILADVAAKALNQVRITVKNLLKKHMDEEQAEKTAVTLTQGTWTHDYPIDVDQVASLGINVNTGMPSEIYSLMSMYPQPRTARPSVEYSPGPVYPSGPKE
jgi:ClpP class serine protease